MPPKSSGGGKKSKAAKQVTNKRRRGFVDPDLKVSKRQAKKDDAKFVGEVGNFKPEKEKQGRDAAAAADSDSSDDEDTRNALGRKPRQRTHVFKNFAARISEVDVDVHRMGELHRPARQLLVLHHGSLVQWADNCGADYSALKAEIEQLCQSLPQLVLHQNEILDAILRRLTYDAKVSLEAILACLRRSPAWRLSPPFANRRRALDLARSGHAAPRTRLRASRAYVAAETVGGGSAGRVDADADVTQTQSGARPAFRRAGDGVLLRAAPDGAVAAGVDALLTTRRRPRQCA